MGGGGGDFFLFIVSLFCSLAGHLEWSGEVEGGVKGRYEFSSPYPSKNVKCAIIILGHMLMYSDLFSLND